jgi:hypothetical protein
MKKDCELQTAHALTSYRSLGLSPGQLLCFMQKAQMLDTFDVGDNEELRSLLNDVAKLVSACPFTIPFAHHILSTVLT